MLYVSIMCFLFVSSVVTVVVVNVVGCSVGVSSVSDDGAVFVGSIQIRCRRKAKKTNRVLKLGQRFQTD
jgi:hypothetical protein